MFKASPGASVCGTSYHGISVKCSFDDMVKKLGKPHASYPPGDKVRYEWVFTSEDGKVVTVYDWKEYCEKPSEWHLGAFNQEETVSFEKWFSGT